MHVKWSVPFLVFFISCSTIQGSFSQELGEPAKKCTLDKRLSRCDKELLLCKRRKESDYNHCYREFDECEYSVLEKSPWIKVDISQDECPYSIDGVDLFCAVDEATRIGAGCVLDVLLNKGEDVNSVNSSSDTPLHVAVRAGRCDSVNTLLKYEANPNITNSNGDTPLHLAASLDSIECMQMLLDGGASQSVCNTKGLLPIHKAVTKGNNTDFVSAAKKTAVALLVDSGSDIDSPVCKSLTGPYPPGTTPLHLSTQIEQSYDAGLILQLGANLEAVDAAGRRPLHYAVLAKNYEVTRLLIRKDACLDCEDKFGFSPLDYAQREEYRDENVLRDFGIDTRSCSECESVCN